MTPRRLGLPILVVALLIVGLPTVAAAKDADSARKMELLASLPSGEEGARPVNSDMAFWGNLAYVGNYNGFRIIDISQPGAPQVRSDFRCFGPQGDPSVWDRDGNGAADLLITSVDRTMSGPACGASNLAHDDPTGWEGLRLFDVSDPAAPFQIGSVYQDCGSHTNTLLPDLERGRLLVLNSSYPLRPGPTCGPVNGPAAGRDPLHGVIQVVEIPLADPAAATEIAELPITYPGDADNTFTPSEHGLSAPGLVDGMRACHDLSVFVELGLVGAACAEQAQLWRIDPVSGLPDTTNPLWSIDRPNVDFWHSATFSWDGKVVVFSDESFGGGCPTVTTKKDLSTPDTADERIYQTGNTFFVDVATGALLSEYRIGRATPGDPEPYCSSHLGNVVPVPGRNLLVSAFYRGGTGIIDFTNPRKPREIAFHDQPNADAWSSYWYEPNPKPDDTTLTVYANDGVHVPNTGAGFQVFSAEVGPTRRAALGHLNPQVQERVLRSP